MTPVTAVIVTHNSAAEIGPCLDSLKQKANAVVVDNDSKDASILNASGRAWVTVIRNPANRGFAAGVNQGVVASSTPLILLLNPDTVVETGLQELATACEVHGLAAGKLVGDDGQPQAGFTVRRFPSAAALSFEVLGLNRLWPRNPVNRRYRYLDRDLDQDGPVEQPAGAFLMLRRDVFEEVGGFDESFYPVWFEDVDFAKRAADLGYQAQYVSCCVVRHKGAHSVARLPGECRKLYWYVSLLRYAAKHFRSVEFRAVCAAVASGCLLRSMAGLFGERGMSSAHGRVIRLAMSSLWAGRLCSGRVCLDRNGCDANRHIVSHPLER